MTIIADLQIHSKYARAVSNKMDLFEIAHWAGIKGIDLVATGDWTHPLWFEHIQKNLQETTKGIFSLQTPKEEKQKNVRFLLSTEISSIYTYLGKQRRVHNLIFSPSLETCRKIIKELNNRGCNLAADGRPIIGLSSQELIELVLIIDEHCLLIPAHAWTPWFALFGSKSGYDSIKDCFGVWAKYIYAIETGLSSDPAMNWQISELDNRSIVSFSDAHSGPKLGREATVFINKNNEKLYTYFDIAKAIKKDKTTKWEIGFTIEFFPEEGKYHWSGHRLCNIRYNAQEIKQKGIICPVCHKPLTIGVENRVLDVADRTIRNEQLIYKSNKNGLTFVYDPQRKRVPFVSLIPLLEIFVDVYHSPTKAQRAYDAAVIHQTEFDMLMKLSQPELEKILGNKEAEAILKVRKREVTVDPGYDGVFGTIQIPISDTNEDTEKQPSLF